MKERRVCITRRGERGGEVVLLGALSLLLVISVGGCVPAGKIHPDQVVLDPHASGDNQCGNHSEILANPLRVVVESQQIRGVLGGKGSRHPVPHVPVTFTIKNPQTGAAFAENGETTYTALTNSAGVATAQLRLGHRSGDVDVVASVEMPSGAKHVELRATAGLAKTMSALEARTGGTIQKIGLRLFDSSGSPIAGVPVFYRVEGDAQKATVGGGPAVLVLTDENGWAITSWKLGTKMQQYFVTAEIRDDRPGVSEDKRFHARAVRFSAMATDTRQIALSLGGGLALLILGIKLMSGGLQRMADRRLKTILETMTTNRFVATGVGAGLTSIIQSSSATTVMTVGFVNAGLMTLPQAIGVIYGANIGTTVTGQIVAFQFEALIYPSIALGLVFTFTKQAFRKHLGEGILGFGLLFLGMMTMTDILKPLQHSPQFVSLFQIFDCTPAMPGGFVKPPQALMCILVGTAATMIVQSSSATVGLVIALAGQGLISFHTAVPLVLGDNIGTTITAILASLGGNRNAKRAALAHTLFNVFGTIYMYGLFFLPLWNGQPVFLGFVDFITPGDAFGPFPENLPRHVANAHTFFNVFNVIVFLPLVNLLARMCQRIIPLTSADREQVLQYLEPHLLQSPSIALTQAVNEVIYMIRQAQKSINESCQFFYDGETKAPQRITEREQLIDRLQREITAYLVELSRKPLTPQESTLIPALVHAVNDAERIGDHSENLLELHQLKQSGRHQFSEAAQRDIRTLQDLLNRQFEATCNSLLNGDSKEVDIVLKKEREITDHMRASSEAHVRRLEQNECAIETGVIFLDLLAHLERVGDHLVNIAERAGTITASIRS